MNIARLISAACFLILTLLPKFGWSESGILVGRPIIFVGLGLGQSVVISASADKERRVESPISFAISLDHPVSSSLLIAVEHFRTMKGAQTAVGFTGGGIKFYPWMGPLHGGGEAPYPLLKSRMTFKGFAPYLGLGGGFVQASIPPAGDKHEALAVGGYVSLKGGFDWPIGSDFGLRAEGNFASLVAGSGQVTHFDFIGGITFTF